MRFITFMFLLARLGGEATQPASAPLDCTGETTWEELYGRANVVFVGTVIGLNELDSWPDEFEIRTPAMLRVEQSIKGEPLPRAVAVHTYPTSGLDGYHFRIGEETLVFARWAQSDRPEREEAPHLWTTACTGTQRLDRYEETEREALLAQLRALGE